MVSETEKKPKSTFINILATISAILIIFIFLVVCNYLFMVLGDSIKTLELGVGLQNHVQGNNLETPIPYSYSNTVFFSNSKTESLSRFILENNFNKSLSNFTLFINENYYYEEDSYDCKYWAYVWTLYYKQVKERYNWQIKYITTDNHIFVMVYNDTGYCMLDQNKVFCRGFD